MSEFRNATSARCVCYPEVTKYGIGPRISVLITRNEKLFPVINAHDLNMQTQGDANYLGETLGETQ